MDPSFLNRSLVKSEQNGILIDMKTIKEAQESLTATMEIEDSSS